ncbi:MAG: GTP-binding protein [Candidatus Lokiarchaeota archaeon]|nr:GTP-binding protein [Candidatus Lokiarchaeota archaeon]
MDSTNAIIYLDIDKNTPKIRFWYPYTLPENFRREIVEECISIISGDPTFIPEVLLIFPISHLKIKVLIKYFKREAPTKKEGILKSAIIFLFAEENDQIYYRYMSYIDSYFSKTVDTMLTLEKNGTIDELIHEEIVKLHIILCNLTEYLSSKSQYAPEKEDLSRKIIPTNQVEKSKFKVVVLGDPSVGKTSTILRFTDNVFLRAYIPTMGLNITQKIFDIDKNIVELVLWDLGGQTKFESIRRKFYEGTSILLLMFDLTNPMSFANVPKWYQDIKNYMKNNQVLRGYLIGNKNDLVKKRIVSESDAIKLSYTLDLEYLEISALTGYNVEIAFHKIARKLLNFNKVEE